MPRIGRRYSTPRRREIGRGAQRPSKPAPAASRMRSVSATSPAWCPWATAASFKSSALFSKNARRKARKPPSERSRGVSSGEPRTNSAPSLAHSDSTNFSSISAAARTLWLKCKTARFPAPNSAAKTRKRKTESAPPEHATPTRPPDAKIERRRPYAESSRFARTEAASDILISLNIFE